jgi:hypothetical protein
VLNDVQADGVYRYYNYLYGYAASEDTETEPPQLTGQVDETTRGA